MGVSSCNPGQVFLRDFVEGSLKGMYIFRFGDILWVLWPVAWPAHSRSAAHGRFRLNSRNQGQAFYSALYYAVYSSFVMHSGIQCMLSICLTPIPPPSLPHPAHTHTIDTAELFCAQMEEDIGGMDLMPGRSLVKFDPFISFHVKELPWVSFCILMGEI